MVGLANQAFLAGDYGESCTLLHEAIRVCPHAYEPYHTLGIIHEEREDINKALLFYMVAAHLKPKDSDLWKRLATLSR